MIALDKTSVGLLAPSFEARELLRAQMNGLESASIQVEVNEYCGANGDRSTRRFMEARPDVIIVDMEDPRAAIRSLEILHGALPETWLLVTSHVNEPDLIIETMRAGAREYLLKPMRPSALSQAVSRYLVEKQRNQREENAGEIHCVSAAKGGSGATTLTINLARALADLPDTRVALIDLNSPIGDAAAYLNLRPQYTASDALGAASRLDSVLLDSYMSDADGFALLPGPKEFWTEQPPGMNLQAPAVDALGRMLEVVARSYRYAIVDLNSSLDKPRMEVVIDRATSVVVILTPELPALWRTQSLFEFLKACGGKDKVRLVVNRCRRTDQITAAEIEKTLDHPVFWKLPNDYNASIEAINSGKPLVSTNHTDLSAGYRKLAHRMTGISPPSSRSRILDLLSLKRKRSLNV